MTFIKWFGSKRRYVSRLASEIPTSFNNYYEPFLGGGSMFFYLKSNNLINSSAYLSDVNIDLVCAYMALKDPFKYSMLIQLLEKHQRKHNKKYYIHMGRVIPDSLIGKAARFLYLNRTAFSGLWPENASGEFNVPLKNEKIVWQSEVVFSNCSLWLRDAVVSCKQFHLSLVSAQPGDFVYIDPPYTQFCIDNRSAYTKSSFSIESHKALREECDRLTDLGVFWMQSNSADSVTESLYRKYKIKEMGVSYNPTGTSDKLNKTDLIITNY